MSGNSSFCGKMLVTVFLSVLVVALALGNIFLSIASPKKLSAALLQARALNGNGADPASLSNGYPAGRPYAFEAPLGGLGSFEAENGNDRLRYLGKRVERLEQ